MGKLHALLTIRKGLLSKPIIKLYTRTNTVYPAKDQRQEIIQTQYNYVLLETNLSLNAPAARIVAKAGEPKKGKELA